MSEISPAALAELAALKEKSGGKLPPHSVIEQARSSNSALHDHFEWSDTRAGHAWRIHQAKTLVHVVARIWAAPKPKPVQAVVVRPKVTAVAPTRATVSPSNTRRVAQVQQFRTDMRALHTKYSANPAILKVLEAAMAVFERMEKSGAFR